MTKTPLQKAEAASDGGRGKWVVARQDSHPRASTPPSSRSASPSSLRLGRGDRRRRRGRAAAGRAGVAGGAQALRRPLLRAPPLRGRQVRARRRAPQVRAAPAGLHRHRLRGGALSPRPRGRTRANKQRSAATSPPRPLCAGPALGAQTRGGGSFPPAPGGPRRES